MGQFFGSGWLQNAIHIALSRPTCPQLEEQRP